MMIAIYFEATGNYGSGLMYASLDTEYVHVFSITLIKSCSIPQNTAFEIIKSVFSFSNEVILSEFNKKKVPQCKIASSHV